jgi:hypothetical protein
VFYDIVLEYKEQSGEANFKIQWYSTSTPIEVIPPSYLYYSQRVGDQVHQVPVSKGPTIPSQSTIQSAPTLLTAGKLSTSLFRSRNSYGTIIDNTVDVYEMTMVGPPLGALSVIAVY